MRIGILNELAYRMNFLVQLLQSGMSLLTALVGFLVVFSHTETLGDWRPNDILALLGVYLIVGGLVGLLIRPSMSRLMEDVREGTLDYTLTKPEDAQFLVSIAQVRIWKLTDFVLGSIVLGYALFNRGLDVGFDETIAFAVTLTCGGAIVYSFFLILSTLSFWFIRIDNILVIFDAMYQAGRWPIGLYPYWLKFVLTFIVPIAFAITVPAEGLIGRLDAQTLGLDIGVATLMIAVSRLFWRYGLRNYSGASA
tara:strand:+ start:1167 stop:1922 length:756 start_codon:yes stop_codon:yes gene_type:complete